MFKRLMPRARGMAYMIRRRSAHITIGLADLAAVPGRRPTATDDRRTNPTRAEPRDARPMGQKIRPTGFRVGIMEDWRSRWYASKHEFTDLLVEDFKIRKFIKGKYSYAGIPKIEIERTRDAVKVILFTARPGRHHRPQGGRGRAAPGGAADAHRPADRDQDRGGHPPRDRRPADQRGHRRAAPEAVELPPDDEAGARADDGRRRPGRQDPALGPPRRLGNVADRGGATSARSRCRTLRAKIDYGFAEAKTAQGHIGDQGVGQPRRLFEDGGRHRCP